MNREFVREGGRQCSRYGVPVSSAKTASMTKSPAVAVRKWVKAHEALWGYPPSEAEVQAAKRIGSGPSTSEERLEGLDHIFKLTLDQLHWAGDDSGSINLVEAWALAELDIRQVGCGARSAVGKEIAYYRKEIAEAIDSARD